MGLNFINEGNTENQTSQNMLKIPYKVNMNFQVIYYVTLWCLSSTLFIKLFKISHRTKYKNWAQYNWNLEGTTRTSPSGWQNSWVGCLLLAAGTGRGLCQLPVQVQVEYVQQFLQLRQAALFVVLLQASQQLTLQYQSMSLKKDFTKSRFFIFGVTERT